MIQIIEKSEAVIEFLRRDGLVNTNILSYLDYDKNAKIYSFKGDVERGVIVGQRIYTTEDDFMVATTDVEFLRAFWDFLPKGTASFFSGVAKPSFDILLKVSGVAPDWQSLCKTYAYIGDGDFYFEDNLTYPHDALNVDDAEVVNHFYTYKHEESLTQIRRNIEDFDTSCIRIDGELAAWCLVHEDGSLGPLYTKEEFRRKGLGALVSARLMQKLVSKGKTPFVHIVHDNTNPLALVAKFPQMAFTHDCVWFGLTK